MPIVFREKEADFWDKYCSWDCCCRLRSDCSQPSGTA